MVKVSLFINTLQTWHEPNKALESRPRRAGFDSQRWQNYGVKSPAISTIWLSVSQLSTPGGPTRLLVKGLPAWPHGMGRPATRSPPLLWRPAHGRKATPRTGGGGAGASTLARRRHLRPCACLPFRSPSPDICPIIRRDGQTSRPSLGTIDMIFFYIKWLGLPSAYLRG